MADRDKISKSRFCLDKNFFDRMTLLERIVPRPYVACGMTYQSGGMNPTIESYTLGDKLNLSPKV